MIDLAEDARTASRSFCTTRPGPAQTTASPIRRTSAPCPPTRFPLVSVSYGLAAAPPLADHPATDQLVQIPAGTLGRCARKTSRALSNDKNRRHNTRCSHPTSAAGLHPDSDQRIEVDVDNVSATGRTSMSPASWKHIEEAGLFTRADSARSLPRFHTLSPESLHPSRVGRHTLAKALNVGGLMNVQYASRTTYIYAARVNRALAPQLRVWPKPSLRRSPSVATWVVWPARICSYAFSHSALCRLYYTKSPANPDPQ